MAALLQKLKGERSGLLSHRFSYIRAERKKEERISGAAKKSFFVQTRPLFPPKPVRRRRRKTKRRTNKVTKKSFFPVPHSRASSPFLRAYKKYTRGDPATKRLQHTNDDDAKHVLTNMEEGIQQGSMRREFEGGGGGGNKKNRL